MRNKSTSRWRRKITIPFHYTRTGMKKKWKLVQVLYPCDVTMYRKDVFIMGNNSTGAQQYSPCFCLKTFGFYPTSLLCGKKPTFRDYFSVPSSGSRGKPEVFIQHSNRGRSLQSHKLIDSWTYVRNSSPVMEAQKILLFLQVPDTRKGLKPIESTLPSLIIFV
jgi:hypothetical protein